MSTVTSDWQTLIRSPEFLRFVTALTSSGLEDTKLISATATTSVKRKPKMEGSNEDMFVRPDQLPNQHSKKEGRRNKK